MIYQQVTLLGDAEWPKVADAMIEAVLRTQKVQQPELRECLECWDSRALLRTSLLLHTPRGPSRGG